MHLKQNWGFLEANALLFWGEGREKQNWECVVVLGGGGGGGGRDLTRNSSQKLACSSEVQYTGSCLLLYSVTSLNGDCFVMVRGG